MVSISNNNSNSNSHNNSNRKISKNIDSPIDYLFDYHGSRVFYKGWILTYKDSKDEFFDSFKHDCDSSFFKKNWVCKYAVISKVHKCLILYDYEPTNELISYNFDYFITSNKLNFISPNHLGIPDKHYRLDNQTNYEFLINYWKKKSLDFDPDKSSHNDDDNSNKNTIYKKSSTDESPNIQSNGTFRFAGLFFKKDKAKHSSLKRAKSGIQLERKKLSNLKIEGDVVNTVDFNETRKSFMSPIRPSRSHESLASPQINTIKLNSAGNSDFPRSDTVKTTPIRYNQRPPLNINQNQQILDCLYGFNLNSNQSSSSISNTCSYISVNQIHKSLLNEEGCFEMKCYSNKITIVKEPMNKNDDSEKNNKNIKYYNSELQFTTNYFLCRSIEERDKWIQCLKNVSNPNESLSITRHQDNSLQLSILEAKGNTICSKLNKKYFCEIFINNSLSARTSLKDRNEILFWGENFEFSNVNCDYMRIDLYQQSNESSTQKKKSSKKDKDSITKNQAQTNNSTLVLLGTLNIPFNNLENTNNQPIEKWYKLEPLSCLHKNDNYMSSNNLTEVFSQAVSINSNGSNSTQNFGKDSLTIRIKLKYQTLDILPLNCYKKLLNYIKENYLNLMLTLEPHLHVRIKDDLSNSLVKIFHKLGMQTRFLADLVLSEVLKLEDNSLTFRGNSLATKAMESYMKLVGDNYLKQTLSDCIRSIIDTSYDLEIDPSKVSNQSSLQANREELVHILHLVCGRIFNSCIYFPLELKRVFSQLRYECKRNGKNDEMCDNLISACIFLRFICPAILSPNLFNLTQEYPEEKAARKLTLAAKTLQTIANFSKFGGKELYMSFDKMNTFVDEHSILMREFLRNISTMSNSELLSSPIKTNQNNRTVINYQTVLNFNASINEINFELELIDIGKQACILHGILVSTFLNLDESTLLKIDQGLKDILNEINNFKMSNVANNTLYSYENPLHHALVRKNETINRNTDSSSYEEVQNLNNNSNSNYQNLSMPSRFSSENYHELNEANQILNVNNKLESEIYLLKQKLRDTEVSLKKEQREKSLIEFKLKQQQQDNDQQMRQIINRLIKVEEELRKEQAEMQKLLRIKQDLIEIQNKRIDNLTKVTNVNNNSNYLNTSLQHLNNNSNDIIKNSSHQRVHKEINKIKNKQFNLINNPLSTSVSNPAINTKLENGTTVKSSKKYSPENSPTQPVILNEKYNIAASPSSSSSSMTQFCNYLASNIMNPQLETETSSKMNHLNNRKKFCNTTSVPSSSISSNLSSSNNVFSSNNNGYETNQNAIYNSNYYLRTSEL